MCIRDSSGVERSGNTRASGLNDSVPSPSLLQFAEYRPQFDLMMAFVRKRFAADRALPVLGHTGLNLLIYDHLLHLFQDQLAFEVRFLPLNRRPTPLFADKS